MAKFKVGDKVRHDDGDCGVVVTKREYEKKKESLEENRVPVKFNRDGFSAVPESDLKLIGKEVKMKNASWGVKYNRDSDPVEFFETREKAEKRITNLLEDNEVDKKTIYLLELGKIFKVERPITFKMIEVKKGK